MSDPTFVDRWREISKIAHDTAQEKGFWDHGIKQSDGDKIVLIHSELSEAVEALRQGNPPDDKIPDYSGVEAELADAVIRIMDLAVARDWRLPEAIIAKMRFNADRERLHGGKKF